MGRAQQVDGPISDETCFRPEPPARFIAGRGDDGDPVDTLLRAPASR
jgi:hypothetical protein